MARGLRLGYRPDMPGIVIVGAGFDGVNRTLWPGFTFEYRARTRRARHAGYLVTGS